MPSYVPWTRLACLLAGGAILGAACLSADRADAAEIADGLVLRGDMRLRNESYVRSGGLAGEDFSRARVRLRLGLDARLDDEWDFSFRLATGGGPTSTNQDLDALDDKAQFYVDRAFLRFRPGGESSFELLAGRMPNPYVTSLMLWDSDLNPDGLAEKFTFDLGSRKLFLTAGQHVLGLRDLPDGSETYSDALYAFQPGVSFELGDTEVTAAAGYYAFVHVADPPDIPEDHAIADLHAAVKWSTAGGVPLSAWMHGFTNLDADGDASAAGAGIRVGSSKGRGEVSFLAEWAVMGRNAIWVDLEDGTLTKGFTDVNLSAVRLGVAAGVGEATTLGVKWWHKDDRDSDAHENALEVDLVAKF